MSDVFSLVSSAVKVRIEYDDKQNAIYIAEAPPGANEIDNNWRIKKLTYDANNNVVEMNWANKESIRFTVSWQARATYAYS